MKKLRFIAFGFLFLAASPLHASPGTEAASFLDIPIGARPAAMGSAYSALATDAYAPTWNPAGLGYLDELQVAAQHLSYVQSTHYEYASFGLPFDQPRQCTSDLWCGTSGVGGSIQYFGSGNITGLDASGNPIGDYSTHYAAYNVSYGRTFHDKLSLGATGKLINASLAGVSANTVALDFGSYYQLRNNIQLAGTLMNMGGHLTFLSEGDPLPLAFHAAGAYQPNPAWNLTSEWIYPRNGQTSIRFGGEWLPYPVVALRMGYRTDNLKGLSPVAGLSTGFGVHVWGQELAYAWVPYGDLGDSHYISLVMTFGEERTQRKRNLVKITHPKRQSADRRPSGDSLPEYDQLMNLLDSGEIPSKKK